MFIPLNMAILFLLVFMRIMFFFSFMPNFGDVFVPARVRAILAFAVALVLAPLLLETPILLPTTLGQIIYILAFEAMLGLAFGLLGRIVFAIFQFAGQIMGHEIGFGMVQSLDPTQAGQMPVIAQTLFIASILVFFAIDAHHIFLKALARSFAIAPPGSLAYNNSLTELFINQGARLFEIAVQVSLPIVAVVFVINTAMGMVAKGVPRMHVFFERFPICIMVGLFLLAVISNLLVRQMIVLFESMDQDLEKILRAVQP